MRVGSFTALMGVLVMMLSTASAQAIVIDPSATGQPTVNYPTDQNNYVGVALSPGSQGKLATAGIPIVTDSTTCSDPWLSADLILHAGGLCSHGGIQVGDASNDVIHAAETLALTWDPLRQDWSGTRNFVEQFLRDSADSSGSMASPFAVTTQYRDGSAGTNRAFNRSVYGGGCIDYGNPGGASCQFSNAVVAAPGLNYPGCPDVAASPLPEACKQLNDAAIRDEITATVRSMDLVARFQSQIGGAPVTPLVVVELPYGVTSCIVGNLCSVNGKGTGPTFCTYHSHIDVDGTQFAYVVQPWTAGTACDEPKLPVPASPDASIDAGIRLVSPLSAGISAAIVNPFLDGWFNNASGAEINDNSCAPEGQPSDNVTLGASGQIPYVLQPEFNNAGAIEYDPYAPACAHGVNLRPAFAVPSPISQGNVVAFDGSVTNSTLMVPAANYSWNFGDGSAGVLGPSVVHAFAHAGTYTVTLNVVDRGGNLATVTNTVTVLDSNGQPVPSGSGAALKATLQLMPQGLSTVLRGGVSLRLSTTGPADGIATLFISRSAALQAHIHVGNAPSAAIARGTVSGLRAGSMNLRVRIVQSLARKLARLHHLTLTIQLALVGADHHRFTIEAAGHY